MLCTFVLFFFQVIRQENAPNKRAWWSSDFKIRKNFMLSRLYNPEHLSNILDSDISPKVWAVSGVLMRFLDSFEWGTRFIWL